LNSFQGVEQSVAKSERTIGAREEIVDRLSAVAGLEPLDSPLLDSRPNRPSGLNRGIRDRQMKAVIGADTMAPQPVGHRATDKGSTWVVTLRAGE
jgi:hypothetical protein